MSKLPNELTPETLIKRVMSGTKEYRSNAYLEAFKNLSSIDLHHSNISRLEIIKLWNSLQSTPNKVRYFTFSLTRDNHLVSKKVEEIYKNDKYAYICHDKDTSAEHKHYHYLLMFESPRSFKSIANDLEIPVTMLQKVYSKKGILDYLTHENDPDKHHYSLEEIHANFDVEEEKNKYDSGGGFPIKEFYNDYCNVRNGSMSARELLDKYMTYCATLHISTAIQLSERLFNAESSSLSSGASLSSRSEFRGRTSVSNLPVQTVFAHLDPNKPVWLDHGSEFSVGGESPKVQKKRCYRKPNPRSDLNDVA